MAEIQPQGAVMPLWQQAVVAWGGRADSANSRLHEVLAASYPVWGWREAETVAEELQVACISWFPFSGPQLEFLGPVIDAWANDVHRVASLEAALEATEATQAAEPV